MGHHCFSSTLKIQISRVSVRERIVDCFNMLRIVCFVLALRNQTSPRSAESHSLATVSAATQENSNGKDGATSPLVLSPNTVLKPTTRGKLRISTAPSYYSKLFTFFVKMYVYEHESRISR